MLFSRTGASRILPSYLIPVVAADKRLKWELSALGIFFQTGCKDDLCSRLAESSLSLSALCPFLCITPMYTKSTKPATATRGLRLQATRRTLVIIFTTVANPKVCGAKAIEQKKY